MGSDMSFSIVIVGPLLLGAVLWWLLNRHENRRLAAGQPRHSGLRLVFASAAILAALFTGGCSLFFLGNMDGSYVNLPSVVVVGGPPFLITALWSVVAMSRSRTTGIKVLTVVAAVITAAYVIVIAGVM